MPLYLGIDSSNYTSSAALTDESGRIIADCRQLLAVKQGEKGLRQSDALFQHWENLPLLLTPLLNQYRSDIAGVCASSRPRPVEGSYMPVFKAGTALGQTVAAALQVPFTQTSHQEGHIAAAALGSSIDFSKPFVCAHLSGGTLELVLAKDGKLSVSAATKDISYGQLLDRFGVAQGFPFPAGKYIDEAAMEYDPKGLKNPFSRIKTDSKGMNLSGLETQLKTKTEGLDQNACACFLMERIAESFVAVSEAVLKDTGARQMLITGGVAASRFLRAYCAKKHSDWIFGQPSLCSDNAVGPSLLQGGLFR
ncbi:MAG: DNA-binding protein [Firmicutes bacterium]|nr:DNA-binding protein [Bacillota bacterium]